MPVSCRSWIKVDLMRPPKSSSFHQPNFASHCDEIIRFPSIVFIVRTRLIFECDLAEEICVYLPIDVFNRKCSLAMSEQQNGGIVMNIAIYMCKIIYDTHKRARTYRLRCSFMVHINTVKDFCILVPFMYILM